jgi:DedD protein
MSNQLNEQIDSEKNELNDIILNKNSEASKSKKVLVVISVLAIILIIAVVVMNRISSDSSVLPQAVLPPEPTQSLKTTKDDPLFEPIDVVEEDSDENHLNNIAKKLKEESLNSQVEEIIDDDIVIIDEDENNLNTDNVDLVVEEVKIEEVPQSKVVKTETKYIKNPYYIQVGSFSRYEPNKKFLSKITSQDLTYTYKNVVINGRSINKVLVGPFKDEKSARNALKTVKKTIEPGAFLFKD